MVRKPIYDQAIEELKNHHLLFACTCSRKEILERNKGHEYDGYCLKFPESKDSKEPVSYRLKLLDKPKLTFKSRNQLMCENEIQLSLGYPVIQKKNSFASYHLASIVDDVHFGVNTIVRGQDLLQSTAKQIAISMCLKKHDSFKFVNFYHHDLIQSNAGKKLSKSSGSNSIKMMRETGYSSTHLYHDFSKWIGMPTFKGSTLKELLHEFVEFLAMVKQS